MAIGHASSIPAGYAFTMPSPVVGAVRVAEDRSVPGREYGGGHGEREGVIYDESIIESSARGI